jgi:hypothetical protein
LSIGAVTILIIGFIVYLVVGSMKPVKKTIT